MTQASSIVWCDTLERKGSVGSRVRACVPPTEGETIEGSRTMRNRPYPVLKCSSSNGRRYAVPAVRAPPRRCPVPNLSDLKTAACCTDAVRLPQAQRMDESGAPSTRSPRLAWGSRWPPPRGRPSKGLRQKTPNLAAQEQNVVCTWALADFLGNPNAGQVLCSLAGALPYPF